MRLTNAVIQLYEACGNKLLIVHLPTSFFHEDQELRQELKQQGLAHQADSVLVITGNPQHDRQQKYHVTMDVFEPRGTDALHPELPGCWSIMCGNGIRAVASYLATANPDTFVFVIQTKSGKRQVEILRNNMSRVCMGYLSTQRKDLEHYVCDVSTDAYVKNELKNKVAIQEIVLGLNGDQDAHGHIDGEPHLIIFINNPLKTMNELVKTTDILAPRIATNRNMFPQDINVTFAMTRDKEGHEFHVDACTFERGVEYVTQSCGTAATVIGSTLLSKDAQLERIIVHMPGGNLHIDRGSDGTYFLTGHVTPIQLPEKEV